MRCEVAIIGAGISGLSAAAALSAQGIGAVVFEARDVIGGRIRTYRPADGGPALELGAQVIHGDRNPVRDLAGAGLAGAGLAGAGLAGVSSPRSDPVPRDGTARVLLGGRLLPFGVLARGGMPPWVLEDKLAAEANLAGPDTVACWLAAQGLTGGHLRAAAEWFRQNWAAEPRALSARAVAAARCGDQAGDGEYAFEGGFGSLAHALAAAAEVRLGQPVRALSWSAGRVELTAGAERVTARAAVITVPPPLVACGRPAITPMPEGKAAAARALPHGDGLCAVAVMSRAAPESAVVFDADGRAGFVRCTAGRPEVLVVAKAGAASAVRAGGAAGLAALVARAFGWPARITGVRIADWGGDPWSAGAFSYPHPGVGQAACDWAAPVRRTLFFAGEATTAGSVTPSVHGALRTGLRAAREVMEAWAS
jgi:monoamine oxidase